MPDHQHATLSDCTEYRQTLLARAPRIVHGTVLLSVSLLAGIVVWSACTEANLVVRVPGRIRPVTSPQQVLVALGGPVRTAGEGRITSVHVRLGDEVREGKVLVQFETEGLEIEIANVRRTIHTGEYELAELDQLLKLAERQHSAARARVEAELAEARAAVQQDRERQIADERLARIELETAQDEATR